MLGCGCGARWTVRPRRIRALPIRTLSTSASVWSSTAAAAAAAAETQRPATAFKQHPDIAHIRDNVALHEANTVLRNYAQHREIPSRIAARAVQISDINTALRQPRAQIKALQARLTARGGGADKAATLAEIRKLKPVVDALVAEQAALEQTNRAEALLLPNLTSPLTPVGDEPKLLAYINYDPASAPAAAVDDAVDDDAAAADADAPDHSSIAEELGLVDFASASMASGWGFYYLLDEAALLEQALVQYALAVVRRRGTGWRVVTPPSLVYSHVAEACGFQPRDADDLQQIWQVAQAPRDAARPRRSLAATAEIPLAALHAGRDVPAHALPLKVVGASRCYRAEAGARGVDTRGLYRVHEFTKVEMFAWAEAGPAATAVFDEMVDIQRHILASLGLACRVLEMPTADLGASAHRKVDIEARFPARRRPGHADSAWGEVTSASLCTDYQTRRLDTRTLAPDGSRKHFPHTVNGTALAVPRVLAAVLEHGWRPRDRCVVVPAPLRPYMDGLEVIGARPGRDSV